MKDLYVEICCGSADDVIESAQAGANRVELNSDLFHGGLTPSIGSLLVAKEKTDIPVMTMIRPREGGFCYTDIEFETMCRDAEMLLKNGSDGLVFGFLHSDGTIDADRTRILVSYAKACGKEAVFHRAFDVVPDWKEAVDLLISLGVDRILTSGQAPTVARGVETLKEMITYAAGKIQILPGGGIDRFNYEAIVRETNTKAIHFAAHKSLLDPSVRNNRSIYFGGALYPPEDVYRMIDREHIKAVIG